MSMELQEHAATLGDPSAYFVDRSHGRALVVESATGEARYYFDARGGLRPFDADAFRAGVTVANPPGFAGFPAHDPADPRWDLAARAAELGDPSAYFVHLDADEPLVVEHATGTPRWRIAADGTLKPA